MGVVWEWAQGTLSGVMELRWGLYLCICLLHLSHCLWNVCMCVFTVCKLYFIKVTLKTYLLKFIFSRSYIDNHLILRVTVQDLCLCIIYSLILIVPDLGEECQIVAFTVELTSPLHVCNTCLGFRGRVLGDLVWAALWNLSFQWNVLLWLSCHLNPVIVLLD